MTKNDDAQTTTSFTIAGIPIPQFERFLKFCEENSTITKIYYEEGQQQIKRQQWYAGAIKMLLDIAEADGKNQMLYDKIKEMGVRLEKLESKNGNKK